MQQPIWEPSQERQDNCLLNKFFQSLADNKLFYGNTYQQLHQWSLENPALFWHNVWNFCDIKSSNKAKVVLHHTENMEKTRFFLGSTLNFAENCLRQKSNEPALISWSEDRVKRQLSYQQLYDQVSQLAAYFRSQGVRSGDRIAAIMPNVPETVIAMLAANSIGATWASCSPDFGVQGIQDRFAQIEPKILIAIDQYLYKGEWHQCHVKIEEVQQKLPSVEQTILVPYFAEQPLNINNTIKWEKCLAAHEPQDIQFEQLPFDHPLYIMFSSGTTGQPKCIVHGQGGTLLQHLKEHQLHCDIQPGDRIFYYTTCGWMMWNWLVSALASNATVMLYDGAPTHPNTDILFDFIDQTRIKFFGISAKLIDFYHKQNCQPKQSHQLDSLATIASTGSPLVAESYDYVYASIKEDVCLSSISGGTDIISCFALGNPMLPVYRGELQCAGLGMATKVFNDDGDVILGEKGELVCTQAFPAQPIGFWNDPNNQRLHATYYKRFSNVWHHGDYAEHTDRGTFIIYGRSDATLNPGGVRIGTAEIYRQVEQIDEVLESIVVGQEWENDTRLILFVVLKEGVILTPELKETIRSQIRFRTSPRHVPTHIIAVADIPRTKSGKIVELAVREVIHKRPVNNINALANPEALEHFKGLDILQT